MTRLLSVLLFLIFSISDSLAWRETGHYSVCEVAYRTIKPQTKEILDKIFEGNPFPVTCTWPDHVRKADEYKHTYIWHFINLDPGEEYFTHINTSGDALQAIINFQDKIRAEKEQIKFNPAFLTGPKGREIREALKFLGHFVGDIHQPLHVGHKHDLGGNKVPVGWEGEHVHLYKEFKIEKGAHLSSKTKEKEINLHKVLDLHFFDKVIAEDKLEPGVTGSAYEAYSTKLLNGDYVQYDKDKVNAWKNSYELDWLNESLDYRDALYNVSQREDLSTNYFKMHQGLIHLRVLQGGIRLGHLLDRIFDIKDELSEKETELRSNIQSALKAKQQNPI